MTKYVSEWLQRAEDDLKTIEVLLREGVALRMVCFHAQQAAEKCMKGYLTQFYVDTRYPEVLGEVSSAEAARAQEAAKRVCDFVRHKVQ